MWEKNVCFKKKPILNLESCCVKARFYGKILSMSRFLWVYLLILCPSAGGAERFYCNFYKGRESVSDRMVVSSETKSGRTLNVEPFWTVGMTLYKTYNEEQNITTVYKERRKGHFYLAIMDLSGADPLFLYGYGAHLSVKNFERYYGLPFTKKNFNSINANPELAKYLPEKSDPNDLSITFYKRKLKCRYISYTEYIKKFGVLIFYYILAGG